jgi:hypothetical protein
MGCTRRSALAVVGLVLGALLLPTTTGAQTTTTWIEATGYATGVDSPPIDGVFDDYANPGMASIGNNGYAELRGRVGFPLGVLPAGATPLAASASLPVSNFEGTRPVAVYGLAGDCAIGLPDFGAGTRLATLSVPPTGTTTIVVDATALVADALATGAPCVELVLREATPNEVNYTLMFVDGATLAVDLAGQAPRIVDIDVMPWTVPNVIHRTRDRFIPVAVLSSEDFAAASIDPATLTFGRTGEEPSLVRCGHVLADVNGDGLADLLCKFETKIAGFLWTDTVAELRGRTLEGWPVRGSDTVRVRK